MYRQDFWNRRRELFVGTNRDKEYEAHVKRVRWTSPTKLVAVFIAASSVRAYARVRERIASYARERAIANGCGGCFLFLHGQRGCMYVLGEQRSLSVLRSFKAGYFLARPKELRPNRWTICHDRK